MDITRRIRGFFLSFLGVIFTYFGETFFKFQKWLLVAFVLSKVVEIPYQILVKNEPIDNLLIFILKAIFWWAAIAFSSTVLWWVGKTLFNVDLWFYYYFWVPIIVPLFGKHFYSQEEMYLLKLMRESYRYEKKGPLGCPVLIQRAHLLRKNFWPHWEFSIIVINTPGKVEVATGISKSNRKDMRWILIVDLTDQSFGIYSNAGKKFLRNTFDSKEAKASMKSLSEKFYEVLNPNAKKDISLRWGETGEFFPLRWASGGSLPIVHYSDRDWAMFFFRDINPIGLNLAIGASESRNEYKDINTLIGREFSEETVILTGRPYPGAQISQHRFTLSSFSPGHPDGITPVFNAGFMKKHRELRKEHDNINIQMIESYDPEDDRPIDPFITPFRTRIIYHKPDLRSRHSKYYKNVLFTINPGELGIEVIWLCRFDLFPGECIIDGEYDMGRGYLVRQPVVMISMDFLRTVYAQEGSLGERLQHSEGKLLPEIPKGEFVIFDHDIDLRRNRLKTLKKDIPGLPESSKKDNLIYEMNRIRQWLADFEQVFQQTKEGSITNEHLRSLCPVSWKMLELIFQHKIYCPPPDIRHDENRN